MYKKIVLLAQILILITRALSQAQTSGATMNELPRAPREFRGVWVATVNNIDWPSRPGLSTQQQQAELLAILNRCVELNLNAVILQVRPMCDALYSSKFEPWSYFLTGEMGKPPSPYYDPLQFAVEEAHKRGLELHAWFNPFRAMHPSAKPPVASNHISKTKPELVKQYGKYLWLDPGETAVQDYTLSVILDVVQRYDIDGVHIDDYFYPYKEKDSSGKYLDFPDEVSWKKYRAGGGKLSRAEWRRNNVNRFVERYYRAVKAIKPWVKVGISPFGIWRPGHPRGVTGKDAYEEIYADTKLWLENGWLDYLSPQLYWKINSPKQPYKALLNWWVEHNKYGRHIWPGNFTSQVLGEEGAPWDPSEIVNQIKATREQKGATGNIHYSMKAFLKNGGRINDAIKSVYAEPALVPASPWLDRTIPEKPSLVAREDKQGNINLIISANEGQKVWRWIYYTRSGNNRWQLQAVYPAGGKALTISINKQNCPTAVAVSGMNRAGNEGPCAVINLRTPARKN